jgi:hypothetical protein
MECVANMAQHPVILRSIERVTLVYNRPRERFVMRLHAKRRIDPALLGSLRVVLECENGVQSYECTVDEVYSPDGAQELVLDAKMIDPNAIDRADSEHIPVYQVRLHARKFAVCIPNDSSRFHQMLEALRAMM